MMDKVATELSVKLPVPRVDGTGRMPDAALNPGPAQNPEPDAA